MVDKTYYKPGVPFCGGIKAGNQIFISGQVPTDGDGQCVSDDIKVQTTVVLNKIKAAIEELGANITDIVKCTVFLTDISMFSQMNESYVKFFKENGCVESLPARAAMEISKLVKEEWLVEIEAIAVVG